MTCLFNDFQVLLKEHPFTVIILRHVEKQYLFCNFTCTVIHFEIIKKGEKLGLTLKKTLSSRKKTIVILISPSNIYG